MVTTRQYNGAHTAGIFADMTVDGPEIGTLVIVFDRAKNLPNRRTMGKQNPYCAARLGKDAKKTETDLRGGQTPKWDQELRFTVHDSPDYNTLKISVFSEDKKTDLIGEAWVNLAEVIVPGGGKNDLWQNLNCKGKYAGEVRIEMTYYDSRPKPEANQEPVIAVEEERERQNSGRVKRRPLPTNPMGAGITPDTIPGPAIPGRAKHGPRDYRTPPRPNSMPPETQFYEYPEAQRAPLYAVPPAHHNPYHGHPALSAPPEPFDPYHQDQPYDEPYTQADVLPQLPPSNRQRAQQPHGRPLPRPQSHIGIPHANSAPAVPTTHRYSHDDFDGEYHLNTDYPEPLHDVDQLHDQMHQRYAPPPHSADPFYDPHAQRSQQPYADDFQAPPPPPMHSNTSPAVPQSMSAHGHPHSTHLRRQLPDQFGAVPSPSQYGASPLNHPGPSPSSHYGTSPPPPRQRYSQGTSAAPHHLYQTPVRPQPYWDESGDEYSPPPNQGPYVTPPNPVPGQTPSPAARSSAARSVHAPYRHSIADPYGLTPPRPHPLSQEVSRARSPQPFHEMPGSVPQSQSDYRDGPPLIKPRPISPAPRRTPDTGRSSYSIQHPVRAFESSDVSPLSASVPRVSTAAPIRKSLSPRPTPPSASTSSIPFGPDSFDVHNPHARPPAIPTGNSPHTPYQIRPGAEGREEPRGPIVGWHGQEIDPSDHLPVDSWAPEPEKKTPSKTYGMGREQDFGPRTAQGITTVNGRVSRDTVINVRPRAQPEPPHVDTSQSMSPSGRNKLTKKNPAARSPVTPLGEHQNYNPVPTPPGSYGGYNSPYQGDSPNAYGAPHIPPKVPMQHGYSDDALAREIQSIDIGESRSRRGGSVPPPTAYVPVRSHRDRTSFY